MGEAVPGSDGAGQGESGAGGAAAGGGDSGEADRGGEAELHPGEGGAEAGGGDSGAQGEGEGRGGAGGGGAAPGAGEQAHGEGGEPVVGAAQGVGQGGRPGGTGEFVDFVWVGSLVVGEGLAGGGCGEQRGAEQEGEGTSQGHGEEFRGSGDLRRRRRSPLM